MNTVALVVRDANTIPWSVLRAYEDWGLKCYDLVAPPRRFWADTNPPYPIVEPSLDSKRVAPHATPAQILEQLPTNDNWTAQTRRSLERLAAFFLIGEDPQRRLDARAVSTLAHQVSLVRHVLINNHLRRVLIADEVGLGKTVEAGLLLEELLRQDPGLRILYLAPARLVSNVLREFDRLGLVFRKWVAGEGDARLSDTQIIGSIHRAVHGANFDKLLASSPWDVLIVDECHHLSDWADGGGDPRQKFKLVKELITRQRPNSRVIFLSGTPHQGHISRFENLVGLLHTHDDGNSSLSGRVIYRTKEDVRDWNGRPLFPVRQVNEPLVIDLGSLYREWIQNIHQYYKNSQGTNKRNESQKRAANWRCAQALQWAVSSPQAGLGYLVRQALRLGWTLSNPTLATAISVLRPYRAGSADEPVDHLYLRMLKEIQRQSETDEVEDIEDMDEESDSGTSSRKVLESLLQEGVTIVRDLSDQKWNIIKEKILDCANGEKMVLFAQPIETVIALANYLQRTTGERPALIIGGQSDRERQAEVDRFCKPTGPRFLVSSRAGGEGINLQVARRLVHIDVPWNPMELEQRVGRVHRFGSRRKILVDTIVVKDSREAHAYRIARNKLQIITSMLVPAERFESIFSRVMCLVPPEELQDVLIQDSFGPLNPSDQAELARMVQEGFAVWKAFHERFAEQQLNIKQQDPGLANWEDVQQFLVKYADAKLVSGYQMQMFAVEDDQLEAVEEPANVLQLNDGNDYFCGDLEGRPVFGANGLLGRQLGLNVQPVAEALRKAAFPSIPTGAAYVRWTAGGATCFTTYPVGILVYLRQTIQHDQKGGFTEQGQSIVIYEMSSGEPGLVQGERKAQLFRGFQNATIMRGPPQDIGDLLGKMVNQETQIIRLLQTPTAQELEARTRHSVTPLFAAVVSA